ncbi:MAG: hypothetical protein AB7D27_02945 [Desulfomicrobium sp.]|jgi:hypothetical protein
MIDFARLESLVDDMAPPNLPKLPNLQQEELGRPEPRSGKAAPKLPNLPNQKKGQDEIYCEMADAEDRTPEECLFTFPIKNSLGSLGNLGEPRATNGYSRPTCPNDNLGSPENLGTAFDHPEDWSCPLGHRVFWVSDYGLKICSKCHPKAEKKRRTP